MSKANQCDRFCPRRALATAEYRQESDDADAIEKLGLLTSLSMSALRQMARAAICPVRNDPAENWQPRAECVDAVRTVVAERPLDQPALTEYERGILGSIIDQNPPA